jgi:hypothetical protein
MSHHDYKDSIDDWTSKWEKALEKGIFPAEEKSVPSSQTADSSFFGASDTHPSDEIKGDDASYWGMVHQRAEYPAELVHGVLSEDKKNGVKEIVTKVLKSPNPVRQASTGKDQDNDDKALGKTYDDADLDKVAKLKEKLHDLQDKLAAAEGKGDSGKKLESQIDALMKQIDDASDALGQGDEMTQQGD